LQIGYALKINTLNAYVVDMGLFKWIAKKIKLDSKQDVLVSGQNIKTLNGKSLLGEGDIKIEPQPVSDNDSSDEALISEIEKLSAGVSALEATVGALKVRFEYIEQKTAEINKCLETQKMFEERLDTFNEKLNVISASIVNEVYKLEEVVKAKKS
jgi:hypothetical protein